MKQIVMTLFRVLVIVGACLLLTDALGYTKTTVILGVDLWKIHFGSLTILFIFEEISIILKSYIGEYD